MVYLCDECSAPLGPVEVSTVGGLPKPCEKCGKMGGQHVRGFKLCPVCKEPAKALWDHDRGCEHCVVEIPEGM